MLSVSEVKDLLQLPPFKILELMKESYLVKSFYSKKFLLPLENYHLFLKEHGWLLPYYQNGTIPEGFYSANMLAERYNEKPTEIQRWLRQGRFHDVFKIGATSRTEKMYLVPENSVTQYEVFIEDLKKNFISANVAAKILQVGKSTIGNWINDEHFPDSVKWLNTWYVPLTEVERIRQKISEKEQLKINNKMHDGK